MTQSERLTLEQLAAAGHMTARNVRAYQTRGLLQPPRREGRASVYGAEHVERLLQVQRARDRGASLRLLRTLIAEGRDLDGVWDPGPAGPPGASADGSPAGSPVGSPDAYVDVTDAGLAGPHTADCSARRRLTLAPLLAAWVPDTRDAAGVPLPAQVPGSFVCALTALDDAGVLAPPAAVRLAVTLVEAARGVTEAAAVALRAVDDERREAAAARIGELAGALVEQLVTASAGSVR